MTNFHSGEPSLFEAFIKSAQYIVRLKAQQDVWDHLAKFILTYFPARWIALAQRDSATGISLPQCTLSDADAGQPILTDEVRTVIGEVLENGFLASQILRIPAPSMTVFLPIVEEHRPVMVMLIGHQSAEPLPNDLLNIYLALAGLAGTTFERLRNERELNRHRAHLEELVEERTAELHRANRELEGANRELEAFSYSVSHDLRAPLRAIDGFSRILIEEYAAQLPPDAQRYLTLVRGNTQQMDRLVDDLLAFSRLSRQPLTKQPVDLTALAQEAWEGLHADREGRRVEIAIDALRPCRGDAALLRQVWVNLLSNALKFTRSRDAARIHIGCFCMADWPSHLAALPAELHDAARTAPRSAVYFVRDNGVGFDRRYAPRLFGVFQRLHRTEEYEGTGVGLAIVQRILHRHGGRVWAEGEAGKGATIYFTL